jgi:hypothetical protein
MLAGTEARPHGDLADLGCDADPCGSKSVSPALASNLQELEPPFCSDEPVRCIPFEPVAAAREVRPAVGTDPRRSERGPWDRIMPTPDRKTGS